MASEGRVASNTIYLSIASVLQKFFSFGYFAFLAKSIGSDGLGQYRYALTFTSIFIIFMDLGLGQLLTREIAKDEKKLREFVQLVFGAKIFLVIITLPVLFFTIVLFNVWFKNVNDSDVYLVIAATAIILVDTFTYTLLCTLRALKNMKYEAFGILLYQAIIISAGVIFLKLHLPLIFTLIAILCGSLIQFLFIFFIIKIKTDLSFRPHWKFKTAKKLLRLAAPFAIAGIIFRISGSVDSMLLKIMAGNSYAGWYELAFRLIFALTVLPGAFATSFYPAVSSYAVSDRPKLAVTFERGVFYMFLISLPIAAGVAVLGDNVILRVWGPAWAASIEPLWILITGVPFVFLNYPIGNFLNAIGKQTLNTINMLVAFVINLFLNYLLIPSYTFNGAAVAVVISSIILVILGLPWVYRIAPFDLWVMSKKIFLLMTASIMMAGTLYFVQNNYDLLFLIFIGALVYFSFSYMIGAINSSELKVFYHSIKKT